MSNSINLIEKASIIVKKYNDIAEITGENFNIFNILNVRSSEVNHSRMIAELLNPSGSHGMKDLFLKLFIQLIFKNQIDMNFENWLTNNAKVTAEKWIGNLNNDIEGGRIDIYIQLHNNIALTIENKIFAGNQQNQLRRYYNFNKNAFIIYLTLDGKEADDHTTQNIINSDEQISVINISYQNEIIEWLTLCTKESYNKPLVRETILQYLNLLKSLTNQTTNNIMSNEILQSIVSNGNNVKGFLELIKIPSQVKNYLLQKLANSLSSKIKEYNSSLIIDISTDIGYQYESINIKLSEKQNEFAMLSFLSDFTGCYIEVVNLLNEKSFNKKKEENVKYYENELNHLSQDWGKIENMRTGWHGDWVCKYNKLELNNSEFWAAIADNTIEDLASEVANDLLIVINAIAKKPF